MRWRRRRWTPAGHRRPVRTPRPWRAGGGRSSGTKTGSRGPRGPPCAPRHRAVRRLCRSRGAGAASACRRRSPASARPPGPPVRRPIACPRGGRGGAARRSGRRLRHVPRRPRHSPGTAPDPHLRLGELPVAAADPRPVVGRTGRLLPRHGGGGGGRHQRRRRRGRAAGPGGADQRIRSLPRLPRRSHGPGVRGRLRAGVARARRAVPVPGVAHVAALHVDQVALPTKGLREAAMATGVAGGPGAGRAPPRHPPRCRRRGAGLPDVGLFAGIRLGRGVPGLRPGGVDGWRRPPGGEGARHSPHVGRLRRLQRGDVSSNALAGAAVADITPPVGARMGGYGKRTSGSVGIMDPLFVRALVLSDGRSSVALAVCDLLGVGSEVVSVSRRLIEETLGLPADAVLVGATHTHAGPSGFRSAEDPEYTNVVARQVAGAVAMAHRSLEPVTLKLGAVEVATVSQNRRDPGGPVQSTAQVLLCDRSQPAPPVATLVSYACHATVLEHDNLEYSPDFPGAMARSVESLLGGTAIYLQGACGDVNPVWSRHDRAEVERVGGVLAGAVGRLAQEMRPLDTGQWCINLSWSEDIEVPCPGQLIAPLSLAAARTELELPRRPRRSRREVEGDLREMEATLETTTDVRQRRELSARINELATSRLFPPVPTDRQTQRLEVQALRLSDQCAVVSLPGEFFAETGAELVDRCGLPALLVAGYANGSVGYVPPARAFPEGGYEVGMTQFGPEAEAAIVDAAISTVRSLYR